MNVACDIRSNEEQVPSREQTSLRIKNVTVLDRDMVQQYWQTLYMHDLLKYRLCDVQDPNWDDVKEMIRRMGQTMYCIIEKPVIIGEFMLENFTGQAAQIHFSVLPGIGAKAIPLTRWTIKQIFECTGLKTLFGLTPATNRAARIFNLKVGFKNIGILPNGMTDRGQIVDGFIMVKEA